MIRFIYHSTVFYHIQNEAEAALFKSQLPTIVVLTKGCKSAKVVRDLTDIPAGCGASVITPTVALYVLVRVRLINGTNQLEAEA
jgi:valyl-tRNA synthetase